MTQHRSPDKDHLTALLREQGASESEIAEWSPVAQRLAEWPGRQVSPAETQRLLMALAPLAHTRSPVRQALRARSAQQRTAWGWLRQMAALVRAQIGVFRPWFWLASAAVALLGMYLELGLRSDAATLLLQALGPLLAFLGIFAGFRGTGLRTLEYELACPPSPFQLLVARLIVVLDYAVALGFCLSVALWRYGGASFIAVTLHWLMPLLLVAGVTVALSLRLPSSVAAALAYAGWLSALALADVVARTSVHGGFVISVNLEIALGVIGIVALALAAYRYPAAVARQLPAVG